jgi:probable HAF family extracellular repeat protein
MRGTRKNRSHVEPLESRTLLAASIQPLGDMPAWVTASHVEDLSDDGSTVLLSAEPFGSFLWTRQGGLEEIGNGFTAVSADGSVAAGLDTNHALTRWTRGSGLVVLNAGPVGTEVDTSADGSVITVTKLNPISRVPQAQRWTDADGLSPLGDLWPGRASYPRGISSDGNVIVGDAESGRSISEAFRWTAATGMQSLGFLPGAVQSRPEAASADGRVVVGVSGFEAFRWVESQGMTGLGGVDGTPRASRAYDVNGDGSVIVGDSGGAFVWIQGRGMRSVRSVLAEQGADVSGWRALSSAVNVSTDGKVIVGEGVTSTGEQRPWVATLDPAAPPPATVVGRYVFYNHSSYDQNDPAATAADDAAIAPDKSALSADTDRLPGFDNVTGYDKGINGVMIDVQNLPVIDALLDARDFDFGAAGAPTSVTVRPRAGVNGSVRVTLVWRDYNPQDASPLPQAVGNGWLTITVKANYHTGLTRPDVFRFGNLVGETGDANSSPGWRVNAIDLSTVKRALNTAAPITAPTDFNRDGRTNALDITVVKAEPESHPAAVPTARAGRRDHPFGTAVVRRTVGLTRRPAAVLRSLPTSCGDGAATRG